MKDKIRKCSIFALCWLVCIISTGTVGQANVSPEIKQSIDKYLSQKIDRHGITGAAIAIVKDGDVIYDWHSGLANIEREEAVSSESMFHLHSLSKIFVSTAIFQLIEEGKVALDHSISKYIKDLPKSWRDARIEHLLSHSCGWGDIAFVPGDSEEEQKENVYKAELRFQPGADFWYNQTNYWLLNQVIEVVTAAPMEEFIIDNQFETESHRKYIFDNTPSLRKPRATAYSLDRSGDMIVDNMLVPEYMLGAGGIYLSLEQFVNWNRRLESGDFVSPKTAMDMWRSFNYGVSHDFAHGWAIYARQGGGTSVGFSGGGKTGFRKYLEHGLTIIVLTNGYKYRFNVNHIIDRIANAVIPNIVNPEALVESEVYMAFLNEEVEGALNRYDDIKKTYPSANFENMLNSLGYELLAKGERKQAVQVFQLNVQEYPTSWNVYDSLAEGYEASGEVSRALAYYKKSLVLNPSNNHATERISILEE